MAQARDPEAGVEFSHGGSQPVEVLDAAPHQAVEIAGGPFGPVGLGGYAADHQVVDTVAVRIFVRLATSGRGCSGKGVGSRFAGWVSLDLGQPCDRLLLRVDPPAVQGDGNVIGSGRAADMGSCPFVTSHDGAPRPCPHDTVAERRFSPPEIDLEMGYSANRFRGTPTTMIPTGKALRTAPNTQRGGYRRPHWPGRRTSDGPTVVISSIRGPASSPESH